MFGYIIVGWAVGMTGYILINKLGRYNNLNFYDVKSKVKKFKRIRDEINEVRR